LCTDDQLDFDIDAEDVFTTSTALPAYAFSDSGLPSIDMNWRSCAVVRASPALPCDEASPQKAEGQAGRHRSGGCWLATFSGQLP
jgi:hypothetical protein